MHNILLQVLIHVLNNKKSLVVSLWQSAGLVIMRFSLSSAAATSTARKTPGCMVGEGHQASHQTSDASTSIMAVTSSSDRPLVYCPHLSAQDLGNEDEHSPIIT